MNRNSNVRRVVIFLCLAVLTLAALTPGAAGLPLAFLVVTVCSFGTISLILLGPAIDEESHPRKALAFPVFSPRPPPAL